MTRANRACDENGAARSIATRSPGVAVIRLCARLSMSNCRLRPQRADGCNCLKKHPFNSCMRDGPVEPAMAQLMQEGYARSVLYTAWKMRSDREVVYEAEKIFGNVDRRVTESDEK